MVTIKSEIKTSGNSLMKNKPCEVLIKPSRGGKIRIFSNGADTSFNAEIDNLYSTDHCVTLCSKDKRTLLGDYKYKAMLCEHFMAACAICKIDSIDVYLSETEFPIFDGSAKVWVELFKNAGIDGENKELYTVSEPVYYLNGKTSLVILPDNELTISYAVNYDHPDLTRRWVSLDLKNIQEIIEARTFGFYKDLKKYQMLGFAKGVTIENTVGLKDIGYTTELRSTHEPIKHKILDLLGDLYLTGVSPLNLRAQILVKEAGHAVHCKVAQQLKSKLVKI
ncbi:MAG: UDP-3-O-acyl-N-acetylglucosamine deacetylase [Cyanobacteria bacterium SIG31]|nr:UDP-3-O-acyl-N-acetylglucosamine deacetylase [Cyanobacteria bacterium SIG31]